MPDNINYSSIIRIREVILRTGLPKSTIYEKIKKGTFPNSIKLGFKSVGWLSSDIEAWIEARVNDARVGG